MKRKTAERRRFPRKHVREAAKLLLEAGPRLPGRLVGKGTWRECLILDISPGGARVSLERGPAAGAPVHLEVGRFGRFGARVVWRKETEVGLRFTHDPAEMAELVLGLAVYA